MHDGCIPEPVPEDDFLPESLCNELGIRHEKFRTARDSYLLTALIESRRQSGRVDFILARQKADGSVLAPSGLLMRCGDELPQRARALFAESKTPKVLPRPAECPLRRATGCGKSISPGELEHISQIAPGKQNPFTRWFQNDEGQLVQKSYSPSSLAGFLQCPLTFWIKNLFHIDLSDTYKENKAELESNEYGSVMHAVLDKLVDQFSSQEKLLTACPEAEHDTQAAERLMMTTARQLAVDEWQSVYNSTSARQSQTLPMEVQLQAIERTLAEFVRQHIKDLAEGWCNIAREYTFKSTLPLADGATVRFSMNADRIDRHKDGRWRIIDYKTGGSQKKIDDIGQLFHTDKPRDNYVFQAFYYAYLMKDQYEQIAPSLLFVRNTSKADFEPNIIINKNPVTNFKEYSDEFGTLLNNTIEEIFNSDLPYTAAENNDACLYCQLKSICRRKVENFYR
jgi:RecB family exonuclease